MGTQILGSTSDWEAALYSAKQFSQYNPHLVRKEESDGWGGSHTTEFTIDEQTLLRSYDFTDLRRYQFWVRPAFQEGNVGSQLYPVSIEKLDQGLYPNEELVTQARNLLMKHRGKPVGETLVEIKKRLGQKKGRAVLPVQAATDVTPIEDVPPLWTY